MTQPNDTATYLQTIFANAGLPYICKVYTSAYDTDFSAIAIHLRYEMPERGAIMDADLTENQTVHLLNSFKAIGIETYEAADIADFEIIKAAQVSCALFVAVPRSDATIASKDGIMYLGNDNDETEKYCFGLYNVSKAYLMDQRFNLTCALRKQISHEKPQQSAKPK